MNESAIRAIASQGGLGILAAIAIYALYRMALKWVQDIKDGAERERSLASVSSERDKLLTEKVLEIAGRTVEAMTANTAAIGSNTNEIMGLRRIAHDIGDFMSRYSLAEVTAEKRVDAMESDFKRRLAELERKT